MNPNNIMDTAQIQPILQVVNDYKQVSGLSINTSKSSAHCISTPNNIIEGLQELEINGQETIQHLGIQLGETVQSTILHSTALESRIKNAPEEDIWDHPQQTSYTGPN